MALAAVRDIDGDGLSDLLVGAPRRAFLVQGMEAGGLDGLGGAYLFSGGTGALLRTFTMDVADESLVHGPWYGRRVAGAGDVDGDGAEDMAIASSGEAVVDLDGRADFHHPGVRKPFAIPWKMSDPLAAVKRDLSETATVGFVSIFNGKTGALIRQLVGERPGDGFGCALASLGDLDGDGRAELAVGAYAAEGGGRVGIFDGASGLRTHTLQGQQPACEFGYSLSNVGDLDQDGRADLAVGDPCAGRGVNRVGEVAILSGRDFSRIATLCEGHLDLNISDFGFAIAPLDLPGGQKGSLVVGAVNGGLAGMVFTYSGDGKEFKRRLHLAWDGLYGRPRK